MIYDTQNHMEHRHNAHAEPSCCPANARKKPWYLNKLTLILIGTTLLYGASFIFPVLLRFRESFNEYLRMIAIPMAIGFILGGVIDYYIPREYVSKYLARTTKRTVFYATGLGFLMSACSHGILALSMELHKKGASGPAVVSFLLASPWANLPVTFLLIGFFGWKGLVIIFAAFLVAITTGLTLQALDRRDLIERNKHTSSINPDFSILQDLKKRFSEYQWNFSNFLKDFRGIAKGSWELSEMILWWILIGLILASLTSAFVPHGIFEKYFGPTLLGLIATLLLATVFEVCSEGTSPLAFEIYKQTGAFGNAFVFLMGGVVTDYTEIGLLWINLGKKTALWTLGLTIPQVFLIGWAFNLLF